MEGTLVTDRPLNHVTRPSPSIEQLEAALRASWGADTAANDSLWTRERPSTGQCDVTSLVLRHYLGGDLVLARVFVDCIQTEHHWWNRFDTGDIDLTRDQFYPHQDVLEFKVFDAPAIAAAGPMRAELLERFDVLLRRVTDYLALG